MTEFHDITAPPAEATGKRSVLAIGGLLGAMAASSCCILPLVFVTLGASGAWIGTLTSLAPYQPIFVVVTIGFLGAGFFLVYRRPKAAVRQGAYCARPVSDRFVKIALWAAALLIVAASAFPYAAPYLLDA